MASALSFWFATRFVAPVARWCYNATVEHFCALVLLVGYKNISHVTSARSSDVIIGQRPAHALSAISCAVTIGVQ